MYVCFCAAARHSMGKKTKTQVAALIWFASGGIRIMPSNAVCCRETGNLAARTPSFPFARARFVLAQIDSHSYPRRLIMLPGGLHHAAETTPCCGCALHAHREHYSDRFGPTRSGDQGG